ncbi:MAG TPA: 2-oxoacid:acceptor oxidoreductase family protein [archaeon]|nr:2-oxoacid:acceptor oxidoreductase family protein [archaeon]
MITFGFYGRSGQGVGRAVNLLAKACFASGLNVQSFTSVPSNRRGSPVVGLVKTDKAPILSRQLEEPDYYVVLDAKMMPKIKENSVLILNAPSKPISDALKKKKVKVYSVDATGIALTMLKANVPNTAMLGAITKLFNKISMKSIRESLELGDMARENTNALEEGYRNVK